VSLFFSFKFSLRQKFGEASLHKAAWQRTRGGRKGRPAATTHGQHRSGLIEAWVSSQSVPSPPSLNPIKRSLKRKKKKKAVFLGIGCK
jgi:hypothetical protein